MIVLLGATGYTGRLVAEELARRELPCRLAGRSAERLASVARSRRGTTAVVDASSAADLDEVLDGATALITTVGPFARLGMPVVEAAERSKVPYVDSTGEPAFMTEVYERFAGAGVPLVPACGFDYLPGDLAAAEAVRLLDAPATEVGVHYDLSGGPALPSRGTAMSAVGALVGGGARPQLGARRVRWPDRVRTGLAWPGGERVTVGRWLPGAEVTVTTAVPTPLALAAVASRPLTPLAGLARPGLEAAVRRLPEGPSRRLRAAARFRLLAEARSADGGRAIVLCEGSDPYGLTARFLVEAALAVSADGYRRRGAMAPSEALDPAAALDAVSGTSPSGAFAWSVPSP